MKIRYTINFKTLKKIKIKVNFEKIFAVLGKNYNFAISIWGKSPGSMAYIYIKLRGTVNEIRLNKLTGLFFTNQNNFIVSQSHRILLFEMPGQFSSYL